MAHRLYDLYQDTLRSELPPVCWQLLEAMFRCENRDSGETGVSLADKQAVLAHLTSQEGTAPAAAVIRKRIQRINQTVRNITPDTEPPLLRLTSTKQAFRMTWNQQAIQREQRRILQAQVSADSVRETPGETTEPNLLKPPEYQVFISHAWEQSDNIERYLDEFVAKLRASCTHLPAPWGQEFNIKLWFDRDDMRGNINRMEDQYLPAAADSDFALFMTSDKWCQSKDCQHEAKIFYNRLGPSDQRPYCVIQLINTRDDLCAPYRAIPNYPAFKFRDYANLTQLWEDTGEHTKDEFVQTIREQICQYLASVQPPPQKTRSLKPVSLHDVTHHHWPGKLDLEAHRAIEARIQTSKGDDTTTADTMPAVQTLFERVCATGSAQRITVLLGGFGMGKTVTAQLLAKKLHEARQQSNAVPIPVYLDLRRVIPQTRHGEAVTIEINDLILIALEPEKTEHMNAGQVRKLIETEPCVVIFDGLDEIGNRIGRDHAVTLYRQFLQIIPSAVRQAEARAATADFSACPTRLLLTCRTHFFRDLREQAGFFAGAHRDHSRSNQYQVYHMAPLSLAQIRELFECQLGAEQGAHAFDLIQKIHDLPGLATRPIMARFITETADQLIERHQQGLPINIATIYDELFQNGIERDHEKEPLLTRRDRKQILIALAAHLQQRALQHLPADDLEDWFDTFARSHPGIQNILASTRLNTRNLLHTELENASFLVRDKADKFRFAHTSFFEYFLAEALLQALPDHQHLASLSRHTISRETRQFVHAIAQSNNTQTRLQADINQILCAKTAAEARLFCVRMQHELHPDHTLPVGANLSGLDLRGLETTGASVIWQQVNLADAQLNRWQAERIHFRTCDFQHTQLANATFDHCTFTNCSGLPQGLASARGSGTTLPTPWQQQCTWQHWQDIPTGQVVHIPTATQFTSVAISPDGRSALSGSRDGTVRLWDLVTGDETRCLRGHTDQVLSVSFSPDGHSALSGSRDGTVRLWDLAAGTETRCLQGHTGWVTSVAFSPDRCSALSGDGDGTVRLWDLAAAAETHCLQGHTGWVTSVAFSPDGQSALSGSIDNTMRLWVLAAGTETRCFNSHTAPVTSVAFSPDSQSGLSGNADGTMRLWDLATGSETHCLKGHPAPVTSVAFSPDGRAALSGSDDGSVRLWDLTSGAEKSCLNSHTDSVNSVAFSPNGRTALSGSNDGTARLWDLATGALRTIHYALPDAWATCDAQHKLLNQGGKLWKYATVCAEDDQPEAESQIR